MDVWLIWLVLAVALGVLEILTVTLAVGIVGAAALVTSVVAVTGVAVPVQVAVFALSSAAGIVLLRPVVVRHMSRPSIHVFGPEAHVGKTAQVVREVYGQSGSVWIDGEEWSARTYDEALLIPVGTVVDVLEIKGVIAVVYPRE